MSCTWRQWWLDVLKGAASAFAPLQEPSSAYPHASEAEALAGDWAAVQRDFQTVLERAGALIDEERRMTE